MSSDEIPSSTRQLRSSTRNSTSTSKDKVTKPRKKPAATTAASSSEMAYSSSSQPPNIPIQGAKGFATGLTQAEINDAIYFWRPHEPDGYLGQWFESEFEEKQEDGKVIKFKNAEQYMMYGKALLFAPTHPTTLAILKTTDPKTIKALGRQIPNFNEETWKKHRLEIVIRGNILKFTQNPDLKAQLLATGDRRIIEASPLDRIWGIGFGKGNAKGNLRSWGLNLLGVALERAREEIRKMDKGGVIELPN